MMGEQDILIKDRALSLQAAARVLSRAALELIYQDPHQWGKRGCSTCLSVTSIVGIPFGCERFRQEQE